MEKPIGGGKDFTIIDTGGIEEKSEDIIATQMRTQAELAIDVADVIVFLTDVQTGVTPVDTEIALMLKRAKKPIILVCNKVDDFRKLENDIYEFYSLGLEIHIQYLLHMLKELEMF